jgi:iron complex outermembrane recepter protein
MNRSKVFGRVQPPLGAIAWYRKHPQWIVALLIFAAPVRADGSDDSVKTEEPAESGLAEIVVTAQKREQSINNVPMSIQAVTGDTLSALGIASTADLEKLVPGFTATTSDFATPVYTLRGIGLFDTGFASSPTVSVYMDQIPLPYPIMTMGATLDIDRVEVLKGPQGILFGNNSTGGAINYIAAKPTSTFAAGSDVTFERFDELAADGFVSGPISDTLRARAAVSVVEGGAWQISATRPNDRLGDQRQFVGRLLVDWEPTDRLTAEFNINGNKNNSDTLADQLIKVSPTIPGKGLPALYDQPIVNSNGRLADWTPSWPNRLDNNFFQIAAHVNYAIGDSLNLTSLTSYDDQQVNQYVDLDATAIPLTQGQIFGSVRSFNQELRLAGDSNELHWVVGANYTYDKSDENDLLYYNGVSSLQPFPDLPPYTQDVATEVQTISTPAAFANLEYTFSKKLTVHGGLRYTESRRSGVACTRAGGGGPALAEIFTRLQQVFVAGGIKNTPVVALAPDDCISLTPPPDLSPLVNGVDQRLSESNVSWRGGFDYKTDSDILLYVNDSRGYKAGVISNISAESTIEDKPVVQERVDAYEAGIKAPLLDQRVRVNAAVFDYEYAKKQVLTRESDPVFGLLQVIQNVPKSRIWGAEGDLEVQPLRGLRLSTAATYLHSVVTSSFYTVNQEGIAGDFKGSQLPYTPKISLTGDAQYEWTAFRGMNAFVGSSVTYRSSSNTSFSVSSAPAPDFELPPYATLDLRVGLAGSDDKWRVTVFGRNITNRYYWNFVFAQNDTIGRQAGPPTVYGITVSVKTQ